MCGRRKRKRQNHDGTSEGKGRGRERKVEGDNIVEGARKETRRVGMVG